MPVMLKEHKEILRVKRVELVEEIVLDHALWDQLRAHKLVSDSFQKKTQLNQIMKEQIGDLLDFLPRRGDKAFDLFCKCLIATDQENIVNSYLKPNQDRTDPAVCSSGPLKRELPVQASPSSSKRFCAAGDHPQVESVPQELSTDSSSCSMESEEECDLTDGPLNVVVSHCTERFFEQHKHEAYVMDRRYRGPALILNVQNVSGQLPRSGTDVDRDKLESLWEQLHFRVTVYNDEDGLRAHEIVAKVEHFVAGIQSSAQACVICILTHGTEDHLYGTDGNKLPVKAILRCLDEDHAPTLAGKPKLVFLQACRGKLMDSGVRYEQDEADHVDHHPTGEDLLVCYPTVEGYMAWRNTLKGSWYVDAVTQVFMKHACRYNVLQLLTRVNDAVSRKVSRSSDPLSNYKKQTAEFCSRLRKDLHFFPGHPKV